MGIVLAGAGLAFVIYEHHQRTTPAAARSTVAATPSRGSSGSGIGNAIASVGGAAMSQLGKAASGYLTDEIASLFNA